jgi:hypothetical protein
MASLVTVENGRHSGFKSPIHTVQEKPHFECLIELPGHDILGMPVDNGNEIHPSLSQSDIRNVDPPNVLRILGADILEEIGIDLVRKSAFTKIGTGMNPFNSHFPHSCLNTLPPHNESFPFERSRNAPTAEERPTGVDLVNPVPKRNLFWRWENRPVIEPGKGDSQQLGLGREGKLRTVGVDQILSIGMAQAIPDLMEWSVRFGIGTPFLQWYPPRDEKRGRRSESPALFVFSGRSGQKRFLTIRPMHEGRSRFLPTGDAAMKA